MTVLTPHKQAKSLVSYSLSMILILIFSVNLSCYSSGISIISESSGTTRSLSLSIDELLL